jgi:ABC-2 type transport system ATP-binding protein
MTTMVMGGPEAGITVASPAIVVRNVTKRYGDTLAVDGLSFEVLPGRVTGFLGPNGAGKSTTMRIVLGLVAPTSGTATVLGLPYASLTEPTRAVGAVLETQSFDPRRSGRDHLRVIAAAAALDTARVDAVLELVDLAAAADRKAGTYSLGMRQRLGLAAALLGDPRVLILDEPANGLDPQGIRWLREFLRWFAAHGRAVLVSSHLLAEMAQLADDVVVIDRGRSIRQGPVAELIGARGVRVASVDVDALTRALTAAGMRIESIDATHVRVCDADATRVGMVAFEAGIAVTELAVDEPSLEDAFLALTNGDGAGEPGAGAGMERERTTSATTGQGGER